MKKITIVIVLCLLYIFITNKNYDTPILPDDTLRFRVIASSNSKLDQELKMKIKLNVERELSNIISNSNSKVDVLSKLKDNISIINKVIEETMYKEKNIETFSVSIGKNMFPEKEYKGIKYSSGLFDSLVITLGDGLGDNWWCVLFPPLCLLDKEELNDVEYTFLVKEILSKYKNES